MDIKDHQTSAFNSLGSTGELKGEDFDLVADKDTGKVWILHGKAFLNQETVVRAEYSQSDYSLKFISHDGAIQKLGPMVQEQLRPYISKAAEITGIHTDDNGKVYGLFVVPIIVKP